MTSRRRSASWVATDLAASTAAGCTTSSICRTTAVSTGNPPKAMHFGSMLSRRPR